MRDIEQRVRELPREQLVKAQTLDASSLADRPARSAAQVLPRLVTACGCRWARPPGCS